MMVLGQFGGTLLRRLQSADLPRFWETRCDPALARYQGWKRMSGAQARAFVAQMSTAPLFEPGSWCQIAIADRAAPQVLLGDMGIYLTPDGSEVEFGITLARDAQGLGHAGRAMIAARTLIWARSPAKRTIGIADLRNHASVRLMQRTGFAPVVTSATVFQGRPCHETTQSCHRPF